MTEKSTSDETGPAPSAMPRAANAVLTVDLEDWFHVCGDPTYSDPSTWDSRVKRVHVGSEKALELLAERGARATFFCLGWIARKSPSLVRRIASLGHEIACHGDLHRRVFEMSLAGFREDLRRAKATLEDIAGAPVLAFRAPEWSMRTPENPALAVLVEEGFEIDSSLMAVPPIGPITNPRAAVVLKTSAGPILEAPPLVGPFFSRPAMLGGGWTSRLSRRARIEAAMRSALAQAESPILYLHPWELDDEHPPMRLSPVARWVHFAGRGRVLPRLRHFLASFEFRPLAETHRETLDAKIRRPGAGLRIVEAPAAPDSPERSEAAA